MPPRHSKAQISLFLIVAILIVVFGAVMFFRPYDLHASPPLKLPVETSSVRAFVQACLEDSVDENLLVFGLQGGYIVPRSSIDSLDIDGFLIPFYVYDDVQVIPDVDMLRDVQLSSAIKSSVLDCVDDFRIYTFPVEYLPPKVTTTLLPNRVIVDLTLRAKIEIGDEIVAVPPMYHAVKNSRLWQTLEIAQRIAGDPDLKRGMVDVTNLNEFSKKGYNVTVFPYDDKSFFYVLTDNLDSVYNLPFRFQFAVGVKE